MKYYPFAITGLLLFSASVFAIETNPPKQPAELSQKQQQHLPYPAEQTLQSFTKTVHGGVQHVEVKTTGNAAQIKSIQAHLLKLSQDFAKGDFSLIERIHGAGMPGLARLKTAKADEIKFEYKALPDGGQIHYASEYPEFVQALHEWFDAQAAEHGSEVKPEHAQHHNAVQQ